MKIQKYTPEYREQVQNICLKTAGGGPFSRRKKEYLLTMYCDPYLEEGSAFLLVDEGRVARGYILCAESYETYTMDMHRRITGLSFPYRQLGKAELKFYERHKEEYPAHLHIDILESYTGGGNGTGLMQTLLDHLRQRQIPGVMLNVAASNHRAIQFYHKMGFTLLRDNKFSLTLGKKI